MAQLWREFWLANQQLPIVTINGPKLDERSTPYRLSLDSLTNLPIPPRLLRVCDWCCASPTTA